MLNTFKTTNSKHEACGLVRKYEWCYVVTPRIVRVCGCGRAITYYAYVHAGLISCLGRFYYNLGVPIGGPQNQNKVKAPVNLTVLHLILQFCIRSCKFVKSCAPPLLFQIDVLNGGSPSVILCYLRRYFYTPCDKAIRAHFNRVKLSFSGPCDLLFICVLKYWMLLVTPVITAFTSCKSSCKGPCRYL